MDAKRSDPVLRADESFGMRESVFEIEQILFVRREAGILLGCFVDERSRLMVEAFDRGHGVFGAVAGYVLAVGGGMGMTGA